MLKLETPWDDDEDEDVPHRREEDDDTVPDEDDPSQDDDEDEDDEEPLRTALRLGSPAAVKARYCSPMTATVMVTVTSVCSTTSMGTSPTCFSGPCGMRTCERSTS